MKDSLVAINIIKNSEILNDNGMPLLFYWNGEDDVFRSIFDDISFKKYLIDKIGNVDNYVYSKLALFYYKYNKNEDKEQYNESIINIQDFLELKDFEEDKVTFYKEYLWQHFSYLYKSVFQKEYDKDVNMLSIEDSILNIYDLIKEKHPKRVIKSTVLNYIRSELMKTNNLNMNNTDWIINKLDVLLNERE